MVYYNLGTGLYVQSQNMFAFDDHDTATNSSPSWHKPVGLNFLFPTFESKI